MKPKISLPYLNIYKAKGVYRGYYRRSGQRVRIEGEIGSPQFMARYAELHKQFKDKGRIRAGGPGSIEWGVQKYYASQDFLQLKDNTRAGYKLFLEPFRAKFGHLPIADITRSVIIAWRDSSTKSPSSANSIVRTLRLFLSFCIERDWITANPAAGIKRYKTGKGRRAWTGDELEVYTKGNEGSPLLAFFVALYTGQRLGDVIKMKWSDIKSGTIKVTQDKGGDTLEIPLHDDLDLVLRAAKRKTKGLAIVQRLDGKPYKVEGFKTIFTKTIKDMKFETPGCTFHGLRRNATILLLEAGCTTDEVKAITGHRTSAMVDHYGREVRQKQMAKRAMKKLESAKVTNSVTNSEKEQN